MAHHELFLRYQRNLTHDLGYWGDCACGSKSTDENPLLGTKRAALNWYYRHKMREEDKEYGY